MAIIENTNLEDFFQLLENEHYLLVYFHSPNCSACGTITPQVESLMSEYPDIAFRKYLTVDNQAIAAQNMVFSVPTVLLFKDGQEVFRDSRYVDVKRLKSELERFQVEA